MYDCERGERSKLLFSKKYGASNIQFVHSGSLSAVCSGRNEIDFSLRYWDLYENRFVRYFKGHIGEVKCLDVHPYDDLFISSSVDRTSLIWDLRKEKPVGRIAARRTPASTFDNQGLVFALSAGDQKVHLFDSRAFDKGEFTFFDLSRYLSDTSHSISRITFSPCGKFILVLTDGGQLLSIDSFKGNLVGSYLGSGIHPDCVPSFSPDSQFVAVGTSVGPINIYRTVPNPEDGMKNSPVISRLDGHSSQARLTMFSPTRCMLASACVNVAMWVPKQ